MSERSAIVDLAIPPRVTEREPVAYRESIQTDGLRGGHYVLRAGATDPQQPHGEDEAYFVLGGRATFELDGTRSAVRTGHAILVPAGVPHRFVDIEEDLTLFVLFARRP